MFLVGWTGKAEEEDDIKVWEDNWDDDNIEDDFSQQLKYVICINFSLQIQIHSFKIILYLSSTCTVLRILSSDLNLR